MSATPTDIINVDSVYLTNEVTSGLFPDQVLGLKERVLEVNDELGAIGVSVRHAAATLYDIKCNLKPGNWRAFLKSGVVNCSERNAIDLVSAHEKWLGVFEGDPSLLSGLSARSLMMMGKVEEGKRMKVFEAAESGEKLTESYVRYLIKGKNKSSKKKAAPKSVDKRVAELQAKCEQYRKTISILMDQNKKYQKMADDANKAVAKLSGSV